ncbi:MULTISPECIES: LLM class F420-dependent oxidoreductase [unclassified Nocardioides]|jgi:F420-dependent oxidoreductase-like protein|uniref:LLM class F420-dependent oxidoreductase n=1 Tax=unclassified Nocardioides TaxID=2615069 RepID=UPI000703336C|nr:MULTISPECIES: LLM class F420-dependent oxidoreductase [unclassified Nocardioides]KRC54092.1 LLM class F420-dependent oxidoreductase [Nocardioides sp. Root79]KRC71428.1 LLM class F420-dependent oxidoreductase [Nocardioides sp. Root240]
MRLGMIIDYSGGFAETVELLQEYERNGLELVGVAEAYSFDAVSQLGYIAAKTEKLQLMSSIFQIYTRTPSLTAMTAAGLDFVSDGRFILGLGASGPQVIEGFHGVKYDAPLGRTREVIEVCRQVWQRQPVEFRGKHYTVPLTKEDGGSGLGKPLKIINHPLRSEIPISVAALGPKNVALVAELANGWQPLFFHPQKAQQAWGEALEEGFSKRDPGLGELDIQLQVHYHLGEPSPEALQSVRNQLALYVGGMGARDKNFYNQLACRYGYEAEAKEIQDLYLSGRKAEAAAAVPDELVEAVTLIGDEDSLRRQLREFWDAGVRTLLLNSLADEPAERVSQLGRLSVLAAETR